MPIHCDEARLSYFPVPKVGSSTMRVTLYAIRHGHDLSRIDGRGRDYSAIPEDRAAPFAKAARMLDEAGKGHETLALIRDPVRRFLSGFQSKLQNGLLQRKLGSATLPESGLPTRPDIDVFLANIRQYRRESQIVLKHFRPQRFFLGDDLGYFDHLHRLDNFREFAAFFEARLGRPITFPHIKRQKPGWADHQPEEILRRIAALCERDYELLKDIYAPPVALRPRRPGRKSA